MYLNDLAETLRSAGLTVVEVSRWQRRNHGPMDKVNTITCHHTAGPRMGDAPSLPVVRDGRPGLDGPLAQIFLARNGVVYIISNGLCWHAGVSLDRAFENPRAIGIEAEAQGTGSPADWPPVQVQAYELLCAALMHRYGLGVADVRGHKETAKPKGRKSDPSFDMKAFRQRVLARYAKLQAGEGPTPTHRPKPSTPAPVVLVVPEEDIMRIVIGPDGKVWALYGLTRSYLENGPVLKEFASFYGIKLTNQKGENVLPKVTQEFLDNFDRVS